MSKDPAASPTVDTAPTGVRWWMFALACATSFLLYLHRYTWGIIKPAIKEEFGWTNTQVGWLDSWFYVTYAIGQIPGGMLGDWFGPRMVLSAMIAAWSLGMGGIIFSRDLWGMAYARLVFGLGQAGCYPNLSKVTKLWFPITERSAVQGWVASFSGRMGGAASLVVFGTLILGVASIAWRPALSVLTGVGLLFAIVFAVLFRNGPRSHPWANAAEADLVTQGDPSAGAAKRSVIRWGLVFRSPQVLVLLFQQFTAAYVDNFFSNWMPTYLDEGKHIKVTGVGWMAAIPLVGGAIGGMLAGGVVQSWLLKKTGNRRWSRSLTGMAGSFLAGVSLFVSLSFDSLWALMAMFFILKFFADWSQPTVWATVTDIGGRNSASLFAVINTSGSLAAFVAGPTMGKTIDYFSGGDKNNPAGWTALFILIAGTYIASAMSWLFIDCTKTVDDSQSA